MQTSYKKTPNLGATIIMEIPVGSPGLGEHPACSLCMLQQPTLSFSPFICSSCLIQGHGLQEDLFSLPLVPCLPPGCKNLESSRNHWPT